MILNSLLQITKNLKKKKETTYTRPHRRVHRRDLVHGRQRDLHSESGKWRLWWVGVGGSLGEMLHQVNELKALLYKQKKATGGFVNRFVFYKVWVQCKKWTQCRRDARQQQGFLQVLNEREASFLNSPFPTSHSKKCMKTYESSFSYLSRVG